MAAWRVPDSFSYLVLSQTMVADNMVRTTHRAALFLEPEDFFDGLAEELGDAEGERERRRVGAGFERDDGLPGDGNLVGKFLLRRVAVGSAELADPIAHGRLTLTRHGSVSDS